MDLRRAKPEDAPALAKVHINSWRAAYSGLVPDPHLQSLDYDRRAEQFRQGLTERSEETYIAELDGEAVGLLTLGPCRDEDIDSGTTGEIWGIYLLPEHWRKGLGTQLALQAEQMLSSRGCTLIVLWVFRDNDQARRFYEAMGFEADGTSKDIKAGEVLKAVRYRKTLGENTTLVVPPDHEFFRFLDPEPGSGGAR